MTTPVNRETRRMRFVLVMLLLTSFTLIALDYRSGHGSPFNVIRRTAATVFGPIERAVTSAVHPLLHFHIGTNSSVVSKLEQENAQLRSQLRTSDLARTRAAELDRLLGLTGEHGYKAVPARVVALSSSAGFEWTATIDAGTADGIRANMTVISADGLVGRVKLAGRSSATVVLAIDPLFSVGARLERTGGVGFLSGTGQRPMSYTLLDPQGDIKVGDQLVTWGSPGNIPFVEGVPIGRVVKVDLTPGATTRQALVKPYVDFGALDLVAVVFPLPRSPRAPLPSPAASH